MSRPAGYNHTEETKRKIGAVRRAKAALIRADATWDQKRCSVCGVMKDAAKDFSWTNRKLSSGETVRRPGAQCKTCVAARVAEYKRRVGADEVLRRDRESHRRRRRKLLEERSRRGVEVMDVWKLAYWISEDQYRSLPENMQRRLRAACVGQKGRIERRTIEAILDALGGTTTVGEVYGEG